MQLNTYLSFDGNCRAAFNFYAELLGGTVEGIMTFGEAPMEMEIPPESRDHVMHGSVLIHGHRLMGTDGGCGMPHVPVKGAHVVVSLDSPEDAERVFAALSTGGNIEMPLQQTFWARRYGITVDRFGVPWMVNCE